MEHRIKLDKILQEKDNEIKQLCKIISDSFSKEGIMKSYAPTYLLRHKRQKFKESITKYFIRLEFINKNKFSKDSCGRYNLCNLLI